jgi:hypothetical protein
MSFILSTHCFALLPMQDHDLSVVSGQSGITIEIATHSDVTVGEFRFEDRTDGTLEEGGGGAFSLRDLELKDSAFSFDIDVTNAGELIMRLNSFAVTDMTIGALQFNYDSTLAAVDPSVLSSDAQLQNQYSRLGSLAINDFTLASNSDITFRFTNEGEFAFTAGLPTGSFFYFTGDITLNDTAGKNYISTRVEFDGFRLNDIKLKGVGVGGDSYLDISLGGTQGAISFRDININGAVIGSAGLENIQVDSVSYLHIKGH